MKFHCLLSAALVAMLAAFLVSSAVVRAAPASGLSQGAPGVRALEAPAAQPGVEKAYYYHRHYYHRHYYHRYYHPYYHHYYHHYYHRYYHRRYYHRFYY
jgi:hypothetical protein